MIQDKLTLQNTAFVTKTVMKSYIERLYNVQPIVLPQLMYMIPKAYGTCLRKFLLSYQILTLNIEKTLKITVKDLQIPSYYFQY